MVLCNLLAILGRLERHSGPFFGHADSPGARVLDSCLSASTWAFTGLAGGRRQAKPVNFSAGATRLPIVSTRGDRQIQSWRSTPPTSEAENSAGKLDYSFSSGGGSLPTMYRG